VRYTNIALKTFSYLDVVFFSNHVRSGGNTSEDRKTGGHTAIYIVYIPNIIGTL